jgi:peptidoglycan/LPS O-acetylase OafA/YrhL
VGVVAKLAYRSDIDGLRTIAVLPVVFYHIGMAWFGGGFVGVDVFFVISGYLITRLVLHEIEQGSFSFARFYERRARRLFPAMFVTVVASMLAAQFLLFPEYLTQAAGSAIFAVTSLSNIFFWTQSGYFDTEALTKPLLHTWSLSVEEQFYMVWPAALLLLVTRFGRNGVLLALIAAGVLSLAGAEYAMRTNISTAFYLTPFRIVEFAIGAGVLWVERYVEQRRVLLELCLLFGLLLIGYAVFAYTEQTLFPGVSALVPCMGTALAILGGRAPLLGLVLRNPVSVNIGLISYSVYLIHWPLAVFFDAYFFREPSFMEQLALVALTLLLAALMYRYVETPFRKPAGPRRLSAPAFGLTCALLALLVVLPASIQWAARENADEFAATTRDILSIPMGLLGATPAYGQESNMIASSALETIKPARGTLLKSMKCGTAGELCGFFSPRRTNVLIIGDSHAEDAYNAFATAFPENNYLMMRSQGCAPFAEQRTKDCSAVNAAQEQALEILSKVDFIIVQVRMKAGRAPLLAAYVQELRAKGFPTLVTGAAIEYLRPAPDIYRREASISDPLPDLSKFRDTSLFVFDAPLRKAAEDSGAIFIDRYAYVCPHDTCTDYTRDGKQLLVADEHHMSWEGAVEFGQYVRQTYPDLFATR